MSNEPVYPEAFEPNDFWDEHKKKIIAYVAVGLLAIAAYGIYALKTQQAKDASQKAYAEASSVADFEAVLKNYPGTPVGGNAALQLGEKLRQEKKYDESAAVLKSFIENYQTHPLISSGWSSLAATYEEAGKIDEAIQTYLDTATKYPNSFVAPIALSAQARLLASQGKKEDAKRVYQDIAARYPATSAGRDAQRELRFLQR